MNQDLFGALKTAVERGTSVEKAVQSFLNAGYKEQEVREAAQALTSGAIALTQEPKKIPQNRPPQVQAKGKLSLFNKSTLPKASQELQAQTQVVSPMPGAQIQGMQQTQGQPQLTKNSTKSVSKTTSIMLILLAVFLVVALILTIVFSDQIAGLFSFLGLVDFSKKKIRSLSRQTSLF
jgi:hypothetical protein